MERKARTAVAPGGIDVEWLDADAVDVVIKHFFANRWMSKRKATPLNQLLAGTQSWAAALPEDAKPRALMRRYPRIANHLAASWRDPVMLGHYVESLLVDRRGDRKGFPPDVLHELKALQSYYFHGAFPYSRGLKQAQQTVRSGGADAGAGAFRSRSSAAWPFQDLVQARTV